MPEPKDDKVTNSTNPLPQPNASSQDDGEGIFQSRYREVTISSLIFGLVVGSIMNAAIAYAGLKIGFTIVGSAIAAVLGFGVLRGLLRKGTILETNIGQTVASAVNCPNSGVIFTVPVLYLLSDQLGWGSEGMGMGDFWLLTVACVAGAVLGCAFIIPLRKQMLDIDRLRFPSATAVAAILKSPGAGPKKSLVLLLGTVISILLYLPAGLPGINVSVPEEKLESMAESGVITRQEAKRTQHMASWIAAKGAPEEIIARGQAVVALRNARKRLDEADGPQEAAAQTEIQRLSSFLAAVPPIARELYSDDLAEAAYQANEGDRSWASLRSKSLGWASRPLRGYGSLGWRLSEPAPPIPGDAADAERYAAEMRRVDRTGDGKPDAILSDEFFDLGRLIGLPDQAELVFAIAPFALGAGYLTGKAGLMVLAGGILAYFILTPLAFALGWMPSSIEAAQAPLYGFLAFNRPLGIGLLLGGALMGVVLSLPAIKAAIKSIASSGKSKGGADELGLKVLAVAVVCAFVLLYLASSFVGQGATGGEGWLGGLHPMLKNLIIALVGVIWIWFAGIIISQCSGMTDWSPISGMALLTVILVMLLAGSSEVMGAVLLGAALCVAITCAADMMADLKTGYLVGAQPKRQQVVELIFTGVGPVITMGTLLIIVSSNLQKFGVPIGVGTDTVAPQAQALEAVITGVQGGEMPYMLYGVGSALGVLLGMGAFAGLGVLIGLSMYLPIVYILTYGIGCVINMGVKKVAGKTWAEEWGVPFCAGLIVGEATLALTINSIVLLAG